MRKIILFMVYSLDGFISAEDGSLHEIQDPEVGKALIEDLYDRADALLLGRTLHEGFAQAWPAVANDPGSPDFLTEFAQWIENSPKIVVSKSSDEVTWNNSRLVTATDDAMLAKSINEIKQEPGKDIVVFGGVRIAQTLVRLGLVDEYWLKLQPIALGKGKSLFLEKTHLQLKESTSFRSGVVVLRYAK